MKLNCLTLALVTVGTIALTPGAKAALSPNGTELNGIHMNGVTSNGIARQGTQLNGLSANGRATQATVSEVNQQTGLKLSSPKFTTIRVQEGHLVGVKQ